MRTMIVTSALVGTLAGLAAGLLAQDGALVTGRVSAAEHEIDEGYFAIGNDSFVVLKPGSPAHEWMARHVGQSVTIAINTTGPTY